MFWSAFLGSLASTTIIVLLLIGVIVIWDKIEQRNKSNNPDTSTQANAGSNNERILEIHIEKNIVSNFSRYFPTLHIYRSEDLSDADKPKGVRLRSPAGEIDILCVDEDGNFVVIELKRGKAPDKVVTQVTRYINWVKESLASDGQTVKGLIIAKSFDNRLWYALMSHGDIDAMVYDWHLTLKKFTPLHDGVSTSSSLATAHSSGVGG